jgi:putative polymerase
VFAIDRIDLQRLYGWWVLSLVIAALTFNFVLCFLNTNVFPVSTLHVVGCEFMILMLTFLAGFSAATLYGIYFVIVFSLYVISLVLLRDVNSVYGSDVKIVRDFLIPIAFFWLGKTISLSDADRIVRLSAALVMIVALFELFFLSDFLRYFSVIEYYIARGSAPDVDTSRLSAGGLMVSGVRPEALGRQLLPWLLGPHRVSSVFLEPSSLGNFGIIVALWAVVRSRMTKTIWWGLFVSGVACIVLADTRFAAGFLVIGVLIALLPPTYGTLITASLPFVAVLALLFIIPPADLSSNDTGGRLSYSAFVLTEFTFANWMGFDDSRLQTFDAGYGYLFSGLGIVGVLGLWGCYMYLSGENRFFYQFRNAVGAYFAVLFLISQSQMTIKTASLVWLVLGALSVARLEERRKGARHSVRIRSNIALIGGRRPSTGVALGTDQSS